MVPQFVNLNPLKCLTLMTHKIIIFENFGIVMHLVQKQIT